MAITLISGNLFEQYRASKQGDVLTNRKTGCVVVNHTGFYYEDIVEGGRYLVSKHDMTDDWAIVKQEDVFMQEIADLGLLS